MSARPDLSIRSTCRRYTRVIRYFIHLHFDTGDVKCRGETPWGKSASWYDRTVWKKVSLPRYDTAARAVAIARPVRFCLFDGINETTGFDISRAKYLQRFSSNDDSYDYRSLLELPVLIKRYTFLCLKFYYFLNMLFMYILLYYCYIFHIKLNFFLLKRTK